MVCVNRIPSSGPRPGVQYGCNKNGYCMTQGESGACGTCYSFQQKDGSWLYNFISFARQQKCDKCKVLNRPDRGILPSHDIEKYNEPCMTCKDGEITTLPNGYYKWGRKKITDKEPPFPCQKCESIELFDGTKGEIWLDCADQNPDAENCECDTVSNPDRPKCVCCDTPCGACEECRKNRYKKECRPLCERLPNHICIQLGPTPGTKGSCVCRYKDYNPNGLTASDIQLGYNMCQESTPTAKSDCTGCECTVTCAGNLKLDPNTCSCVDQCADCTSNSQSFGALAATNSCQECRRIDPDNFGCVDICVPPAVCDGSGGCYDPNSSLVSSLLP